MRYEATVVEKEVYDKMDLGQEFEGGIIVDGICDAEKHTLILITRHEEDGDGA